MTTKEFLRQYLDAEKKIKAKLAEIKRLKELATNTTQALIPDKVQSSFDVDKTAAIIAKFVDMRKEVGVDVDRLKAIKKQVVRAIETVKDERLQSLLRFRYICGYTFERIAVELDLSYVHVVHRLHPKALKEIFKCNRM